MAKSDWRKEEDTGRVYYTRLVESKECMQDNLMLCYEPSDDHLWMFDFMSEHRTIHFNVHSFKEADKLFHQLQNGDN